MKHTKIRDNVIIMRNFNVILGNGRVSREVVKVLQRKWVSYIKLQVSKPHEKNLYIENAW